MVRAAQPSLRTSGIGPYLALGKNAVMVAALRSPQERALRPDVATTTWTRTLTVDCRYIIV